MKNKCNKIIFYNTQIEKLIQVHNLKASFSCTNVKRIKTNYFASVKINEIFNFEGKDNSLKPHAF